MTRIRIKRKTHRRRPAQAPRKTRVHRPVSNRQMAKSVESYEVEALVPNTLYSAVFDMSFFPRSQLIGQNYQEYRIDKLELSFEPYFNTFQDGTPAATAPQILMVMDRTGRQDAWTKANLEQLGATPRKFVSNMKKSWKPNTLVVAQNNLQLPAPNIPGNAGNTLYPEQSAQVEMNKWYSTQYDCSSISFTLYPGFAPIAWYGLLFWIDQVTAITSQNVGKLIVKAHISFRNPALNFAVQGSIPGSLQKTLLNGTVITPKVSTTPVAVVNSVINPVVAN